MKKFVKTKCVDDYEILTDTGWEPINRIGKTIPYKVWVVKTTSFILECANTHIVITDKFKEVYVKDLKIGDLLQTVNGLEPVVSVIETLEEVSMYDLEVDNPNHRYYTNGILSHNTVWLCSCSASLVRSGKNVLYISGEMGFEEIGKRIDANILDIPINLLSNNLDKDLFKSKFKEVVSKSHGKLIIKEVSPGSCNAKHISNILNEIKLKKGYLPDVLVLDHITLFSSYRLPSNQTGSHLYVACVCEEIRAVAKEYDIVILTAAQFNRGAKDKNSSVSSEDVGLGYGISQTADWSGAIIQSPELKEANKYVLKTIKTRFSSNNESVYTIGIDYSRMRLLNLDDSEQEIPIHLKDQLKAEKFKQNTENIEEYGLDFS